LRESLEIRLKKEPDAWTTFNTRSMLGGALLGQKNHADAGPLLLQGYEGMKERMGKIPAAGRIRLSQAAARLVTLYEETGNTDEAARWRKEVDRVAKQAAP
jgi:eukaryotic-like serine/threonine-protein kinase